MPTNKKQSSKSISQLASDVLRNTKSSAIQKTLAGSVLAQYSTNKQTGAEMEDLASKVLKSPKYNAITKSLAGSVESQSKKER